MARLLLVDGLQSEEMCFDVVAALSNFASSHPSSSSSSSVSTRPSPSSSLSSSPSNPRPKLVALMALCTSSGSDSSSLTPSSSTSLPSSSLRGSVHAHFGLPVLTDFEGEIMPTLERMMEEPLVGESTGKEAMKATMRGLEGVVVMSRALGGKEGRNMLGEMLEHVWV